MKTNGEEFTGHGRAQAMVHRILNERGERYGSFEANAHTAQTLKQAMRGAPGWVLLSNAQREGLEMIQHKIARMLHGDTKYLDNIVDICGYASLVCDSMQRAAAQSGDLPGDRKSA